MKNILIIEPDFLASDLTRLSEKTRVTCIFSNFDFRPSWPIPSSEISAESAFGSDNRKQDLQKFKF